MTGRERDPVDALRENIICRVHRMPDCSPLLNGCSKVNEAHAALDALAARLEAAEARVAELEEALRLWRDACPYHHDPCGYLGPEGCTCGLQAVFDATAAVLGRGGIARAALRAEDAPDA